MVGSMGGWEAVTCSAGHPVYIRLYGNGVAAGAQAIHVWFNDTGAGIIGKTNSHCQENNEYGPLFFISPNAEDNDKQIKRDPEFWIAHQGHQPVEKWVREVVIDEVK